jgi:magnesium transporter
MSQTSRIKEQIQFCIRGELLEKLPPLLEQLHPADIADIIEGAPDDVQNQLFELLDDETKADVIAELDDSTEAEILDDLTAEQISEIAEEMAPDDAADMLAELDDKRSAEVLNLMELEDSEGVRELLQYSEDTAGGRMTTDFVALPETATAKEALMHIGSLDLDEPVYFAYVINAADKLSGYVQIWQLLKTENQQKTLRDLSEENTQTVTPDVDQESVARIMSKYDLSSLPVIDGSGKLLGRVTIDDIIDVLEEEASEDLFKLAGSNELELEDSSPFSSCKARLPWLLITLATGFITSVILKGFMHSITTMEVIALSFFVPIVMGMGGNTGIQSSTLIIRGLALRSFDPKLLHRLLLRELATGMLMGIICGSVIGLWARFVIGESTAFPPTFLAIAVGLALVSAMMFAALFGAAVPLILNRFKIDPAVASGPFVSASNDIFALLIYYGVTFLMISALSA